MRVDLTVPCALFYGIEKVCELGLALNYAATLTILALELGKDKTMWVYRLDYTIWNGDQQQRITGDVVQFEEQQSFNDILSGLWLRWVLLRDENIQVGDCDIQLLSS